jgi:hypothetical protein
MDVFDIVENSPALMGRLNDSGYRRGDFDKEPHWGKTYWVYADVMADAFTGKAQFFFRLLKYVDSKGRIIIDQDVQDEVMRSCNIGPSSFKNYLYTLNKSGALYKKKGSNNKIYWPNPFFFGLGKWEAIRLQQRQFRTNRDMGFDDDLEAGRQDSPGGYSDSSTGSPGDECLLEDPVQTKGG